MDFSQTNYVMLQCLLSIMMSYGLQEVVCCSMARVAWQFQGAC